MKQLIIPCLLLTMYSCGQKKGTKTQAVVKPILGTPIDLLMADKDCQNEKSAGLANLGQQYVYQRKAIGKEGAYQNFNAYTSTDSVRGRFVISSHIGDEYRKLKICRTDLRYQTDTVEGVQLSIMSAVEKTQAFYKNLQNSKYIADVKLVQDFRYIEEDSESKQHFTDNAFYLNVDDELFKIPEYKEMFASKGFQAGPYIVTVPQSNEAKQSNVFNGHPLWEIPFVASHEYGHHIFGTHFPKSDKALNSFRQKKRMESLKEAAHNPFQAAFKEQEFEREEAQNTRLDAIDALNEGFADLTAHYSLSSYQLADVSYLECFKSRDLKSANVTFEVAKQLDTKTIKNYFKETKVITPVSYPGGCDDYINPFDNHMIGSIVAYGIVESLKINFPLTDLSQKFSFVTKWLDKLNAEFDLTNSMTGEEYMEYSIKAFYSLIENTNGKSSNQSESCAKARQIFPAYKVPGC